MTSPLDWIVLASFICGAWSYFSFELPRCHVTYTVYSGFERLELFQLLLSKSRSEVRHQPPMEVPIVCRVDLGRSNIERYSEGQMSTFKHLEGQSD